MPKKHRISSFVTYATLFLPVHFMNNAAKATETHTIHISPAKSREIDLGRAPQSIMLTNPDVATVERIGVSNKIRVTPRSRGNSAILVQYPDGRETTFPIQIGSGESDLGSRGFPLSQSSGLRIAKELSKISTIEAFVEDGRVVAAGRIANIDAFLQAQRIVHSNPESIKSSLGLSRDVELIVADTLTSQIKSMGEQSVRVTVNNGMLAVHGTPSSESGRTRVRNHIGAMFPGFVDAMEAESGEGGVLQVNVRFLEVGKSARTKFGARLAGGDAPLGATLSFPSIDQPSFQIAPIGALFSALKENSAAREIATPSILTRSGEKASFLAGGEVPLVSGRNLAGSQGVTVEKIEFKPYGIFFNVTPKRKPDGTVWVTIDAEFSHIDDSVNYGGVPGFLSRKVSTQIAISPDSAAILSGLVKAKDIKKVEKIPIIGSIPILGELFKSRQFQDENSELWIAVWVQSAPTPTDPSKSSTQFHEYEKQTNGSLLD